MAKKTKNSDPLLEKVKKGLRYVESSGGLKMINPNSSATGLYGQLYNAEELQNMSYLQGVDRQSFASDTTLQNRLFEDRYFGEIPGVPGLGKNANDLRVEYKKVLEDKGISFNYTDDEISALSNLLGRQGTREYFGYVLRDGRSLADVFPKIYGPDAEAPNKTPEKYLETYREGRDLKYGGRVMNYQNGGDTTPDRQQQLKDFQSFYGNYINSPKYRERLESSGYENIDNIINTRSDALNNIQMNVDPGFTRNYITAPQHFSKRTNPITRPPQMQVSELFPKDGSFSPQARLDYTIAHEAGHATDAYGVGLNPNDRMALENYNELYRQAPWTNYTPPKEWGAKEGDVLKTTSNVGETTLRKNLEGDTDFRFKEGTLHDISSKESYADLITTRKYLFDNYNLSPEDDITEEQWKNIYESFDVKNDERGDSNLSIKRFFKKYKKPEDARYILNNIAMESSQDDPGTMAKYGGNMKKYNNYNDGGKRKKRKTTPPVYDYKSWTTPTPSDTTFVGSSIDQTLAMKIAQQQARQYGNTENLYRPVMTRGVNEGGQNTYNYHITKEKLPQDVPPGMALGGNYNQGGDPPKKHKDYLQYNPNYPFTGWADSPYDYETLQPRITEDSLLLQDSWFPSNELMRNLQINREYRDKVRPYTREELYDLKYEGDQSKAYGGRAIPQAGFGDMFRKLGKQITAGGAGIIEGVTGGLLPATKLLSDSQRQAYGSESKMGNLFGSALGVLGGAGLFKGAGAASAATGAAGMSSVPGANTFNALYGSGINPAMMNPSLAGQASTAGASGFGNLFNMGSNFGVGNTASGMFNIYQQGQEGFAMGGRATNPPFMSAMNRPKDVFTGPLAEPTEEINALKSEIARLEESFNSARRVQTARGYSGFTGTMSDISRDAIKAQEELKRLTGKNYAQGGRATNMKQDMGQDINVESGELLMSDMGGQFQSMNSKAPIKEVMPGVSMVQGNQSNDNVPIKIPDGETKVFSKRLGYADKGLELVNQYKELEKTPDSNDFIGQQTKKFELNKIRKKLEELFQEQEKSKSKQIAKRTGGTKIPQAGLGDLFNKAKTFMQSDTGKAIGNFALENADSLYNMGAGAFAPDPQNYNINDYVPDYNPDPNLAKIDTKAILNPLQQNVNAARYSIGQSGGSPSEIIQANMQLNAKAGSQMSAAEAKAQALQNQMQLGLYDTGFKADTTKGLQGLKLAMMNEQRLGQRPAFFKEGLEGFQNYFTGKRNEDFIGDIYNQRYGNLTGTGSGTGTNFNFSLGNMAPPSLNNTGLFDNYQGLGGN